MNLEAPPDTRAGALVLAGLRRGAVLVFLPVFAVGQAIAWLTYAVSGWYHPWSWVKIGIAETLASMRVPLTSTGTTPSGDATTATLEVAFGALTVMVLVLAFRAGKEQATGLQRRPVGAALAGAAIGVGFALPMFVVAFPVSLGFPQFGIERLEPVWWLSFVLPLVVGGLAGAVGGLAAARDALDAAGPWGPRLVAAARGGAIALWWGLVLSFIGFLVVAAVQNGPTGAYARFVDRTGGSGAAMLMTHAVLLPNQSAMVLAMSMGTPLSLSIGGDTAARASMTGVETTSDEGVLLATVVGAPSTNAVFPAWYVAFLLVPAAATVLGGRVASRNAAASRERIARAVLGGLVYAVLCGIAAWGAAVVVPAWSSFTGGSVRLGTQPLATAGFALGWGLIGGAIGGAIPWPAPAGASAGSVKPR